MVHLQLWVLFWKILETLGGMVSLEEVSTGVEWGVLSFCFCFSLLPVCCQVSHPLLYNHVTGLFPGSREPESVQVASEMVSQKGARGFFAQVFGYSGANEVDVMPLVVYLYVFLGRMSEETRQ